MNTNIESPLSNPLEEQVVTPISSDSPQQEVPVNFVIDEEFKNLLPPLSPKDFMKLLCKIYFDKRCDPLVVWKEKGILIDGHNRFFICQEHNIPFKIRELSFENRDDVVCWIIENQKSRRNMNKFQWAEVAWKFGPSLRDEAKKNQQAGVCLKSDEGVDVLQEMADIAEISRDTMHKASVILNEIATGPVKENLKELIEALRRGDAGVSINGVYNAIQEYKAKEKMKSGTEAEEKSIRVSTPKQQSEVVDELAEQDRAVPKNDTAVAVPVEANTRMVSAEKLAKQPQECGREILDHLSALAKILRLKGLKEKDRVDICDKMEKWLEEIREEFGIIKP